MTDHEQILYRLTDLAVSQDHLHRMLHRIEWKLDKILEETLDEAELQALTSQLRQSEVGLSQALSSAQSQGVRPMASPILDQLKAQVQASTDVEASAVIFVNGVAQKIADAVQTALANGATEAELQPFVDLGTNLKTQADALAAAMLANTPAAKRK